RETEVRRSDRTADAQIIRTTHGRRFRRRCGSVGETGIRRRRERERGRGDEPSGEEGGREQGREVQGVVEGVSPRLRPPLRGDPRGGGCGGVHLRQREGGEGTTEIGWTPELQPGRASRVVVVGVRRTRDVDPQTGPQSGYRFHSPLSLLSPHSLLS